MRKQKTFEELLDQRYGAEGTPARKAYEATERIFAISTLIRETRLQEGLTQEQLAERLGTRKTYISRLENGKSDIQLSTLYRLFEEGLGKRVTITID